MEMSAFSRTLSEEVATIHNSAMQPGLQSVKWNGTDSQGIQVASGVYIYRVEAQNRALTGKNDASEVINQMIVIKKGGLIAALFL